MHSKKKPGQSVRGKQVEAYLRRRNKIKLRQSDVKGEVLGYFRWSM